MAANAAPSAAPAKPHFPRAPPAHPSAHYPATNHSTCASTVVTHPLARHITTQQTTRPTTVTTAATIAPSIPPPQNTRPTRAGAGARPPQRIYTAHAHCTRHARRRQEFIDALEAKGMSKDWAKKEFSRRWNSTEYPKDMDPDCGLPRVSMGGDTKTVDYLDRQKKSMMQHGSKQIKAPSQDTVKDLLDDLSSAVPETLQQANFGAFQKARPGFASVAATSSESERLEWWTAVKAAPTGQLPSGSASLGDGSASATEDCGGSVAGARDVASVAAESVNGEDDHDRDEDNFDNISHGAKVRLTLQREYGKMKEDIQKEVHRSKGILDTLQKTLASADVLAAISETVPALKKRLLSLEMLAKTKDEFTEYKQAALQAHASICTQDSAADIAEKQLPCPVASFRLLASFVETEEEAKSLGLHASSQDELQRAAQTFRTSRLAPLKVLCTHCGRLAKQVEDAMNSGERDYVTRASAKAAAKAKGKAGATSSIPTSHRVFHLDWNRCGSCGHKQVTLLPFGKRSGFDEPWTMSASADIMELFADSHVRLNHLVFKSGFVKDKQLKRDMKIISDTGAVRQKTLEAVCGDMAALVGEDIPSFTSTRLFGYKGDSVHFGPDTFASGSLRVFQEKSGNMLCVAFPFRAMRAAVEQALGTSSPSLPDVIAFARGLDQETADELPTPVYFATVVENCVLYIPPGWIQFECGLGSLSTGLHVSLMPNTKVNTENFLELQSWITSSRTTKKADIYDELGRRLGQPSSADSVPALAPAVGGDAPAVVGGGPAGVGVGAAGANAGGAAAPGPAAATGGGPDAAEVEAGATAAAAAAAAAGNAGAATPCEAAAAAAVATVAATAAGDAGIIEGGVASSGGGDDAAAAAPAAMDVEGDAGDASPEKAQQLAAPAAPEEQQPQKSEGATTAQNRQGEDEEVEAAKEKQDQKAPSGQQADLSKGPGDGGHNLEDGQNQNQKPSLLQMMKMTKTSGKASPPPEQPKKRAKK